MRTDWWTQPDLNRQPLACKASALPVGAMGPYRVRVCRPHSLGNNMFRNIKYSNWWGIRDSNPYAFRYMILSHARLPIPPIPQIHPLIFTRNGMLKPRVGSFHWPQQWREVLFVLKEVSCVILPITNLLAGEEGLEPPTHWLTVSCANQLRYTPKLKWMKSISYIYYIIFFL